MSLFEYQYPAVSKSLVGAWVLPHNVSNDLIDEFNNKSQFHVNKTTEFGNYSELSSQHINQELIKEYNIGLHEAFKNYKEKFYHSAASSNSWFITTPFYIRKYNSHETHTEWHCDSPGPEKGKFLRNLCYMTYLHDLDNKGGREFLHQNICSNPRTGLTLIWPAGWSHVHREIPTDQEKYIIVGWSAFNDRI